MLASLGDPYTRFLSPAEVLNSAAAAVAAFILFIFLKKFHCILGMLFMPSSFSTHAFISFRRWGGMTSLVLE